MANVLKITIGSSTYDISPSPSGTLVTDSSKGSGNYYVSNDVAQASATSYTSVDAIAATESNSSIFSKLTSMVKNTRYLHNKVGTTDISGVGSTVTAAISALNTNKAAITEAGYSLGVSGTSVSLKNKANTVLSTITTQDTKNTAGSTDISTKIYLIGASSQAANPQTYSDNEIYATSGALTTKTVSIGGGSCTLQYSDEAVKFVFA